jgi:hypothetical protein
MRLNGRIVWLAGEGVARGIAQGVSGSGALSPSWDQRAAMRASHLIKAEIDAA